MLRRLQKERVAAFLQTKDNLPWKVLILDERTQDVISPLMRINDLRNYNITANFLIGNRRGKIRETPAIYFIEGTAGNIEILIKDIINDLYSQYYINFLNSIKRSLLEKLAEALSERGKGFFIKSIFDQYLNFISLQENLFTLNYKNTFSSPLDDCIIIDSLLGVFLTLKEVPFIVSKTKSEIGKRILNRIKSTNLIKDTRKKPLLILVDRSFDLKSPVEHVWTYNALINDLLDFNLNKVSISNSNKVFDLDPDDDFWIENGDEYFPTVAERVEKELLEYKKEMALRCVDEKSDKKKIDEALEKAPELAKKKASMHKHMSICLEIVEIIKKRCIDDFYRIEKNSYKKQELLDVVEKGIDFDVLRLAISMLRDNNYDVSRVILSSRNIDTKILDFFKDSNFIEQKSGTFYKQAVSNIMGSVKKLFPVTNESLLSNYVEDCMNKIKMQDTESLRILNPFGSHCFEKEISKIVVFCVGGGTYTELKSLNELSQKLNIDIIYGSTEMINSFKFIEQAKKMILGN